ncbi:MAG: D-alanine--D-alanine ligase [Bacteroidota bacterium]|nr:D-alanine--D-alanine ligase [Bacteroidota bacterium]
MTNKKLNIALLLGGTSPERSVSKASAASIYPVLKDLGHNVTLIDPAYGANQPKDEIDFFKEDDYTECTDRNYIEAINSSLFDNIDLAFLALHGKHGEDGTVQALLELRGIKYTGSKVLSSSISMDKIMSKILFGHYDIQTPKWFSINNSSFNIQEAETQIDEIVKYPCVIKPADQGSTVGLSICNERGEIIDAFNLAFKFADKVLVEEYIDGYEMTVAVVETQTLPVLEIKPKHALYDYECKYTTGMSNYIVPAEISEETSLLLQEQALLAFNALGCTGYGRVDFRVSKEYQPYCLEVNTLPGMTSTSLVPKMAKAAGISFEALIERIIDLSL